MDRNDYIEGWKKGFWEGRLDMLNKTNQILFNGGNAEERIADIKALIEDTRRELYS